MVVIQARMNNSRLNGRLSMSIVLDNGDIHHFFALNDGVHHSSTRRFRGSYGTAVESELARPGARVVAEGVTGLAYFDAPDADLAGEPVAG